MKRADFLQPVEQTNYSVISLSHQGYVRPNNEDRTIVQEFKSMENTPVLAAVLCDGVGGHNAGEIAAQIGIDTVMQYIAFCENLDDPTITLKDALLKANHAVLIHAQAFPKNRGMGATCVSALIVGRRLYIANLGDSRAYLRTSTGLIQISLDHTWLADNPDLTLPEFSQAGRHNPLAHVLNRYLGCSRPMEVDLRLRMLPDEKDAEMLSNQGLEFSRGDRLLLCSDGLTDMLDDGLIEKLVASEVLEKSANRLLGGALKAGGYDNITLILVEIPD